MSDETDLNGHPRSSLPLIFVLLAGCSLCIQSMYATWHKLTPLQRQSIVEDFKQNGVFNVLTSIGPFERPVHPVRLSDLSTAHDHCGPECLDSNN